MSSLEARVARLEDIESIRQLKATYCDICDDGHNPDRIVTIFTEDGIWEGKGIANAKGHDEIRALFERFGKMMTFTQHMTLNPRIEVSGDTAHGSWYFFGPFTFRDGSQARWQAARYEEDYRREADGWKIAHLRIAPPTMIADYETGWGEQMAQREARRQERLSGGGD